MVNAYSDNYLKNQIDSATKEQLLIMFYDGAIRFIARAIKAITENNNEQKTYCINKASAIISELSATLDHKIGEDIAADLASLYDYMNRELIRANINNNSDSLAIVTKLLTDLRDTWTEAIQSQNKSAESRSLLSDKVDSFSVSL
ncbi:MAG: flagellar export chaperone FliS [Desulfobacterales bacterium]|nr:flagellar export chaperone FliS [Deltaproteobacteria bacterium]NNK94299.1 flagellar export chaperone FliS [Desulfobacterales bacterium]